MHVTEIPFNALLGLLEAPPGSGALLVLPDAREHQNHMGTVHAGAQLTLAEAASGQLLMLALPEFGQEVLAVVRRVEAKFSSPMTGELVARAVSTTGELRAAAEALTTKGRALIPVKIEVVDPAGTIGLTATFEWFARRQKPTLET
jgi:acyl-coenzyme A thioesterase PaaI-like protein